MQISLVVGIISLLLAVVFFIAFSAYEKYKNRKNEKYKNEMYLGKTSELFFILFLIFSSIFFICFIINLDFIFCKIQNIFEALLNI